MNCQIDFAPEFRRPILDGTKTATTRFLKVEPELRGIGVDQEVECTIAKINVFAKIRITQIENCRFDSIPDNIARIENYRNPKELQTVLIGFYPSISQSDELTIFHFELDSTIGVS